MTKRIGIFPGTFDPVHTGHISFALEAKRACGLDEVILLPEENPRGKTNVTNVGKRLDALHAALQQVPGLRAERLESKQFTVKQTLPELRAMFAGAELTLLIGSDVAHTLLYRWDGLDILFPNFALAIGIRHDSTPDEIHSIMEKLKIEYGTSVRYKIVQAKQSAVSSSKIRSSDLIGGTKYLEASG